MERFGERADSGSPACSSSFFTEAAFSEDESDFGGRAVANAGSTFFEASSLYNGVIEGLCSISESCGSCLVTEFSTRMVRLRGDSEAASKLDTSRMAAFNVACGDVGGSGVEGVDVSATME